MFFHEMRPPSENSWEGNSPESNKSLGRSQPRVPVTESREFTVQSAKVLKQGHRGRIYRPKGIYLSQHTASKRTGEATVIGSEHLRKWPEYPLGKDGCPGSSIRGNVFFLRIQCSVFC